MNSSHTPLRKVQTTPDESVCVAPSIEGCSGGPAIAIDASAQTSRQDKSRRLIQISPLVMVTCNGSGFSAKTPHSTTEDPKHLADFRRFISAGDVAGAEDLCRERLHMAGDDTTRVRWVNNFSIAKRVGGDHASALDLLVTTRSLADRFGGTLRGDMEHGFARSLEMLRRYDPAFEHYTAARFFYEGDPKRSAGCDTNLGRCYTSAGRPEDSHPYFDRALEVAETYSDLLLQGEVWESRALALAGEGRYAEARKAASYSVYLLSDTGYRAAREESEKTYESLRGKG